MFGINQALMGPLSLALMGLGAGLNAFSARKQAKQIARDLEEQSRDLLRRAGFEERMNLEGQALITEESIRAVGSAKGQAAKAGVRTGSGSPADYREAIINRYERQKRLMSMESVGKQSEMRLEAARLNREARRVKKASRWKAFADILGGAGDIGIGGYQMGIWGT